MGSRHFIEDIKHEDNSGQLYGNKQIEFIIGGYTIWHENEGISERQHCIILNYWWEENIVSLAVFSCMTRTRDIGQWAHHLDTLMGGFDEAINMNVVSDQKTSLHF